jgi:crotonobetainyl-CoA:carnitine CoA-transferase CaiB-like acyl-CoA transferase
MTSCKAPLPLAGIRMLDLSRVLAGPTCAMVLGDLGADVIKVEHPERGDDTRDWGIHADATRTAFFNSANRNKQSVTLDLQHIDGQRIARDLARQCDVVIQNFKTGGAEKLGLGFEQLNASRDDLVYCSISGYQRSGPEGLRPGYDLVIQGETGLMALNGDASQPPLKFGVATVDLFTGMYAAQAVLAALYERRATGKGRLIEMALFDCGLMITAYCGLEALLTNADPPRYGNKHPAIIPYGVYDAADGALVITVGNNAQFARFCREVIDRTDLADDARFHTSSGRAAHREILVPEIEREIGRHARATLLARLTNAGIPCGEVLGPFEALTSMRAAETGLVPTPAQAAIADTCVFAPPYRFDSRRATVRRPPPALGQDTPEVLQMLLGLSDHELARLVENGVI